ncbi:MAG: DUF4432 family protein [Celeribacter sp.]|jgi:hypothetical protein
MLSHAPLPDMPRAARHRLPDMVGDLRQLACVQRIALRDGPDAGQPLIAFSTGGGLTFEVKENASLDIRSLQYRGIPIGWRHPAGDPQNRERALTGFLVTCGLENVRAPRDGMAQHGSLALSPVRLTGLGEDWDAPVPHLHVTGEVTHPMPCGAVLRLRRRLTAPIGAASLTIKDEVVNVSAQSAEMMILYHFNFGFPIAAPGCEVHLGNDQLMRIDTADETPAPVAPELPQCRATQDQTITLRRPAAGGWPGIGARLVSHGGTLPYIQTWRDARRARNILALEPVNCDLRPDGTSGPGTRLAPGAAWHSSLTLSFD